MVLCTPFARLCELCILLERFIRIRQACGKKRASLAADTWIRMMAANDDVDDFEFEQEKAKLLQPSLSSCRHSFPPYSWPALAVLATLFQALLQGSFVKGLFLRPTNRGRRPCSPSSSTSATHISALPPKLLQSLSGMIAVPVRRKSSGMAQRCS